MSQASSDKRLLFYVEQNYSFDILRPLQSEARKRGYDVRWLSIEDADPSLLRADEQCCTNISEAIAFDPVAVFAPGDRVPGFMPGLKVQVFHGLNEDKRGNEYPERGLFDLYCTEGPSRTGMLAPLAKQRGYFKVAETGWLKLDTILALRPANSSYDRPQILLASTFTPRLSGADALLPEIKRLSGSNEWQWLITLHPKMSGETVALYQNLENENLIFFDTRHVVDLLHRADVMVSDNSSILQEFLLLQKPVVTYRNRNPQSCMLNITEPDQLETAIREALTPDANLRTALAAYGPGITPFLDGHSAGRVLDAVEDMLRSGWRNKKPRNWWRNYKMRRQLSYYRFW